MYANLLIVWIAPASIRMRDLSLSLADFSCLRTRLLSERGLTGPTCECSVGPGRGVPRCCNVLAASGPLKSKSRHGIQFCLLHSVQVRFPVTEVMLHD